MNIEYIVSLIGSLGFPIVACIIVWRQMVAQQKQHKEEMDKITEALNNNTIAINKLANKIDKDDDEGIE